MLHRALVSLAALSLVGVLANPAAASAPTAAATETVEGPEPVGAAWGRYRVRDRLGRTVTFYLSTVAPSQRPLPLVVYVQGSGCDSLFMKKGEQIFGRAQNLILLDAAPKRVRVLAVEKPGVTFLDESRQSGTADGCSQSFLEEHTLSRWAEAIEAALRAARRMHGIDVTRCLVLGHSEGGIVAAKVAADDPQVTHVAPLSTSGPSQLFDFDVFARAAAERGGDADAREAQLYREWAAVEADPMSTTKMWKGHPYRRWSSFLSASTMAFLAATRARIYLAHGTADTSVPVVSFDVLRAQLLSQGRDVTTERIAGADHSLQTRHGGQLPDEFIAALSHVIDWFIGVNARTGH